MTDQNPNWINTSEPSQLLHSALNSQLRRQYGLNVLFANLDKAPALPWKKWEHEPQTDEEIRTYYNNMRPRNVTCWGFICGYKGLEAIDFDWSWVYRLWRNEFGVRTETLTVQTPNGGARPYYIDARPVTDNTFKNSLHVEIKGPGCFVVQEGKAQREDGSTGEYGITIDKTIRSDDAIIADTLTFLKEIEKRYGFLHWNCLRPHFSRKILGKPSHHLRLFLCDIMACEGFSFNEIYELFRDFTDFNQAETEYQIRYTLERVKNGLKQPTCKSLREKLGWSEDRCNNCDRKRRGTTKESDNREGTTRIESPGQTWQEAIIEQIEVPGAGCTFALHEQTPDGSWRTTETAQFPDPLGKGVYVPMRKIIWALPSRPLNYESDTGLFREIVEFLRHHFELREKLAYDILACFILMTWRMEEFDVVTYLDFLGPKGTGKTKALEVLASISYRGWLITHPTPAAVFWIVDRYHPTILADNYEYWGKETRRELDGLFNAGYRKGATVPRRPREEESGADLDIYKVYCPKVLSGTREPSAALESRCITIRTTKAHRPMPMRISKALARELRSKLLQYRFRHFEKPRQEEDEILNRYGRVGELFHALLTVAPDDETQQKIAECATGVFQDQVEEEATSEEAEVVQAIVACKGLAVGNILPTKNVVEEVNRDRDENDKISPQKIGWVTKRLGFKKHRLGDVKGTYAIVLEPDLIDHLVQAYDVRLLKDPHVTNTPRESSEPQILRDEATSNTQESEHPEHLSTQEGYSEQAPSMPESSTDSEQDTVIRKLRCLKFAPTLEHFADYAAAILKDQAKAKSLIDQLHRDGKLAQRPDGFWEVL